MKLEFQTKARTLASLTPHLKHSFCLPQEHFTHSQWRDDLEGIVKRVTEQSWGDGPLAVRSSAVGEDSPFESQAGRYTSVLDIAGEAGIKAAVERVFDSYNSKEGDNEVLIQPMLNGVVLSGVAFTADQDTHAPYYVINYTEGERTDAITSGVCEHAHSFVSFKDHHDIACPQMSKIIAMCRELEELFANPLLDIEFAINSEGQVCLLQVRPLVTKGPLADQVEGLDMPDALEKLHKKIVKVSKKQPNLLGSKALFGVMPDWNPAEIIGYRPRRLAMSLYQELITDNIWAYQRDNYGYRNLRSHPLMMSFLGIPYIDVRVSLNSFVPKNLSQDLAEKLVDHYLDKLQALPELHDKIEFDVVWTCAYPGIRNDLEVLRERGFGENEIRDIEGSLLQLTNRAIDPKSGVFRKDLEKIDVLRQKYEEICSTDLSMIDKIYWLTEDCKRFGTLPFAGIARSAFIAVQLLKSFVERGVIGEEEYNHFLASLGTVTQRMRRDYHLVLEGSGDRESFIATYGHLRPGTYDILSDRYDENFERFFGKGQVSNFEEASGNYSFSLTQTSNIDEVLQTCGIEFGAEQVIAFIRDAICGREEAKLIFTRHLSQILKLLQEYGQRLGIDREDMSHLDFKEVIRLYANLDHRDVSVHFKENIAVNEKLYRHTQITHLPVLITSPDQVYAYRQDSLVANFVTRERIQAEVIGEEELSRDNAAGKIVFIKSADPGYDYLFCYDIAGLVTLYGGANSHMAIRCAELKLPAVIGAGEEKFKQWSSAKCILMDCESKRVIPVVDP